MAQNRYFRFAAALLVTLAPAAPQALAQDQAATVEVYGTQSAAADAPRLFGASDSDVKFSVGQLMRTLRDNRHEGWVLAAYPDPATSQPLIGAGFRLDAPASDHPQSDPLNPRSFLEPSSAQLWQAAGLDPARLPKIIAQYDRNLAAWKLKKYRRKVRAKTLTPQMSENEAVSLLRISIAQAIHNSRAYCREFDQLTASQQMALSELVFQMGTNLEQFVQFLGTLNRDTGTSSLELVHTAGAAEVAHWAQVQQALIDSQWARGYTRRAIAVIAEFDPDYAGDPAAAQARIASVLHPPALKSHKKARKKTSRPATQAS